MAINKRPNKTGVKYQVKVRDSNGSWYPCKAFGTLQEAKEYERYLEKQNSEGGASNSKEAQALTMDEYWDYWEKNCRSRVGETWRISQDQMWRLHLQPLIGSKILVEIKPQHVAQTFTALERNGVSARLRYHLYNLMHKLFVDAVEDLELITTNPVKRKFKPVIPQSEAKFLSPQEAKRLLEFSRTHYLGPAIWLCLLSGMRSEAVIALKVKNVDFRTRQILICEAWKAKLRRIDPFPKGKRAEYVPMPDFLAAYLRSIVEGRNPDDFVVTNTTGVDRLDYRVFNDGLKRICKRAGVTVVTPHGLRHSASELYIEKGASQEDVRRLLNHKSGQTTLRYMHRTDERLLRIASDVGSLTGDLDRLASVSTG